MRAWHHQWSDTPTSPSAILHHTDLKGPNISGESGPKFIKETPLDPDPIAQTFELKFIIEIFICYIRISLSCVNFYHFNPFMRLRLGF